MNKQDFVIDFVRLNELTSHPNDNPNQTGPFASGYCFSITRKVIKHYMDINYLISF